MDCFYHEGRSAVGCCRACLRGLCRECATDLDKGLACRERCEHAVRELIATIDHSNRYRAVSGVFLRTARTTWLAVALVSLFVGLFVSAWGLTLPHFNEIALLGIPFLTVE